MSRLTIAFLCFLFSLSIQAQKVNTPYVFPIKPGSEKWQSFKSITDMYNACQVPADILSNLTTQALLQTCLSYPATGVLFIHNTPQQGFDEWKNNFNGINELYKRQDAATELLTTYKNFDVKAYNNLKEDNEKGAYAFKLKFIESIIVQDDLINTLTNAQLKQLLRTSVVNYLAIEASGDYGFASLSSTGRIISKISLRLGDTNLKAKLGTKDLQGFIQTGLLGDRQSFLAIMKESMKIKTD
jgi:hypothetical protein